MRRNKSLKRDRQRHIRFVHVLAAAGVGYVLGGVHLTAMRTPEPSAAETVAMRFPETSDNAAPVTARNALVSSAAAADSAATNTIGNSAVTLLSPQPMMPQADMSQAEVVQTEALKPEASRAETLQADASQTLPPPASAPQTKQQAAAPAAPIVVADATASLPPHAAMHPAALPPLAVRAAALQRANEAKATEMAKRHAANRPGYILDDAQIASIKQRLNLTPDQERMWPAVEAALRNMAYTRGQPAHRGADGAVRAASVDPEAVQGLKSAAVPLIMSFNDEQKDEVRNLVHVMGLDQLASEF